MFTIEESVEIGGGTGGIECVARGEVEFIFRESG
jgi:hypothetical protein